MVQSHDGSIKSVVEKGDTLLASVHYPPIRDKINRLKKDYAELCNSALVRNGRHLDQSGPHKGICFLDIAGCSDVLILIFLPSRAMWRTSRCR